MKKKMFLPIAALCGMMLASCDCAHEEMPTLTSSLSVGSVVCSDGSVLSGIDFGKSGKRAVGVVFHVSNDPEADGLGYAVYIHALAPEAFADSLGVDQGTSASLTAEDGNANTYAMYGAEDVSSPLAEMTFDLWAYGQSAYVPSVRQLVLLYSVRHEVNERIAAVGGDTLELDPDGCWLWSSTEVDDQKEDKAWLFSMQSGAVQETPKTQPHKFRPIISIRGVK